MGIFSRLGDIINSNVTAILDRAEDPEKIVRLMIQEMEDTLVEVKANCAGAIASRKRAEKAVERRNMRVVNHSTPCNLPMHAQSGWK